MSASSEFDTALSSYFGELSNYHEKVDAAKRVFTSDNPAEEAFSLIAEPLAAHLMSKYSGAAFRSVQSLLGDKIDQAQQQVQDTVDSLKGQVQDVESTIRNTVQEQSDRIDRVADTARDTLDKVRDTDATELQGDTAPEADDQSAPVEDVAPVAGEDEATNAALGVTEVRSVEYMNPLFDPTQLDAPRFPSVTYNNAAFDPNSLDDVSPMSQNTGMEAFQMPEEINSQISALQADLSQRGTAAVARNFADPELTNIRQQVEAIPEIDPSKFETSAAADTGELTGEAAGEAADVGADVGAATAETVGETIAATTGVETAGLGFVVGGAIALGGLLTSIFSHHTSHPTAPPPPPDVSIPQFAAGLVQE